MNQTLNEDGMLLPWNNLKSDEEKTKQREDALLESEQEFDYPTASAAKRFEGKTVTSPVGDLAKIETAPLLWKRE